MRGEEKLRRGQSAHTTRQLAAFAVAIVGVLALLSGQTAAAPTALPGISIFDASTPEGTPEGFDHYVTLPVTLSAASTSIVTVDWKTVEGTAKGGNPNVTPDSDYYSAQGTLVFAPGETSKNVDVLIDGGSSPEPAESFTVQLSNPVNATIARGTGTVVILNDDVAPPPEPGEVNVLPAAGGGQCVAVKGGEGCQPIYGQQISIDEIEYINPGGGKITLQSIVGIGTFYGGKFDLQEIGAVASSRTTAAAQAKPILVVRLVGGKLKQQCGKTSRAAAGVNAQAKEKPVRRLWGKGKGRFRTRGRYSSGTVRGTNWLTADYCDGTLTRVVSGIVQVYDLVQKNWVSLKPGQSYFAQAGKIK